MTTPATGKPALTSAHADHHRQIADDIDQDLAAARRKADEALRQAGIDPDGHTNTIKVVFDAVYWSAWGAGQDAGNGTGFRAGYQLGEKQINHLRAQVEALRHPVTPAGQPGEDEDEGCPKGDPSCMSRSDEVHDACEDPAADQPATYTVEPGVAGAADLADAAANVVAWLGKLRDAWYVTESDAKDQDAFAQAMSVGYPFGRDLDSVIALATDWNHRVQAITGPARGKG